MEARLIEMSFGEWEGRRLRDLRAELGAAMAEIEGRGLDFRAPGGESPREVQARIRPLLAELGRDGRDRLAVTHKAVIRAIYALATGWPMLGEPPERLADFALHIYALAEDGTPSLRQLNLPLEDAVKPVVLFYVQHLLGIGHLRRAALIARAIQAAGLELRFVSGGAPAGEIDIGAGELIQLPPAVSADVHFSAILDEDGRPIDDVWRDRRRRLLLAAFEAERPDLVLVEMFPFGRRQFAFELLPLLEAAKARGLPTAVSLRDILVAKSKPERIAETVAVVRRLVDRVLVHGDPRLVGLEATFAGAAEIADRLVYTGYVAEAAPPGTGPGTPAGGAAEGAEILVSAGGGAVGGPLLRAALAARPATSLAHSPWRLIAGPNLPAAEFAELQGTAPAGVTVERFRSDFPALLARSRLSLSQAGYNTVMDILAVGARALVLPFAEGAESEQSLRARLLAERGLLSLLEPPIDPARLAARHRGRTSAAAASAGRPRSRRRGRDRAPARPDARMTDAWQRLAAELDRWAPGEATFWWRDDDAIAPSPALERLLGLGSQPLALAVIPAEMVPELAGYLTGRKVDVLQHGYAHRNHEPPEAKKAELGAARPAAAVREDLRRGARLLAAAFGSQALPVLVPPWNRIAEPLIDLLADDGYRGLSTQGPRRRERLQRQKGILQVNTHIDIVDWRGGRGFIGLEAAIDLAVGHLAARREGRAAAGEPTGLLTHHLVLEDSAFDFTAEFLARTAQHPAVQWRSARDIFAPGTGVASA